MCFMLFGSCGLTPIFGAYPSCYYKPIELVERDEREVDWNERTRAVGSSGLSSADIEPYWGMSPESYIRCNEKF